MMYMSQHGVVGIYVWSRSNMMGVSTPYQGPHFLESK